MSNPIQQAELPPYGLCPICGAAGVTRERRPGGNDRCSNGHTYPSAHARTAVAAAMARGAVPQGYTLVPDAALRWLFGEEGDFVCPPDRYFRGAAPPYWWRSVFRDWIAAAPTPEATQPTQAEAPSERERFDAYWLKRQRERGFGAKLTDAEMLAHPSDQDDEFHAWCAALATQQAGQGEADHG